jgi:hypothetical protein
MSEYIASISEAEYKMFRIIMTTELPDDYRTWLLVRERGKLGVLAEPGASVTEIEVSLMEFAGYAKGLKNPNFSIGALDQCARKKAMARAQASLLVEVGQRIDNTEEESRPRESWRTHRYITCNWNCRLTAAADAACSAPDRIQ